MPLAKSYLERLRNEAAYYKFQTERGKRYRKIINLDLAGKHVLEVGCGYGGIVSALDGAVSAGIDINRKLVRRALEMTDNPNAVFMMGDATRMPLKNESFDILLLLDVLEHVDKTEELIRESARVLKKGGVLCVNFASYRTAFGGHLILPYIHYLPKSIAYFLAEALIKRAGTAESRAMFDVMSVKQQHETLNRISTGNILRMLRKYFNLEKSTATTIIPGLKVGGTSAFPDFLCVSRFYIFKK